MKEFNQELKDIQTQHQLEKIAEYKARAAELGLTLEEYLLYLLVTYKYLNRV